MFRTALGWGLGVSVFWTAAAPLAAQEIIQTGHGIFGRGHHQDEPQRIVVKLPPPRVEVHDKCDSCPEPRRCLFGHRDKHDKHERHHQRAPLSEVLYAPATIPTMMMPAPAAAPAPLRFTQEICHDFSALREAQEMEIRAAGLAAQLAARNAMLGAEDDAMQRILERSQGKLQSLSGALRTSAPDALRGQSADNLNEALAKINERLSRLEELVLQHHQILEQQRQAEKKPGN